MGCGSSNDIADAAVSPRNKQPSRAPSARVESNSLPVNSSLVKRQNIKYKLSYFDTTGKGEVIRYFI